MYRQSLLVHQRKPRFLVKEHVAFLVFYFVGVSVKVRLEVKSESRIAVGTALGIDRHIRADVIPCFGGLFRVQVGQ